MREGVVNGGSCGEVSHLREEGAQRAGVLVVHALTKVHVARRRIHKAHTEGRRGHVLGDGEEVGRLVVTVKGRALGDHRAERPVDRLLLLVALGFGSVTRCKLVRCLHLLDDAHLVAELDQLLSVPVTRGTDGG